MILGLLHRKTDEVVFFGRGLIRQTNECYVVPGISNLVDSSEP